MIESKEAKNIVQNMVKQLDDVRGVLNRDDLSEQERSQLLQVMGYLEGKINEATKKD